MRITALCFLGAAIAAMTAGCGSAEPGSSTITGTIDQATFPAAVPQIEIISDASASAVAPVAADGSFSLALVEGASYRFALGKDGSVPLVLRSDGERLQTQVTITGGDASVDIGRVRFWGGSASGDASLIPTPSEVSTADEACVDGLIARTGQPCATGEAAATCPAGDGHDKPGRRHHGPRGDAQGDRDEEALADDPATDASPEQAVGIPELNLALGIGCGGCPGM